MRWREVRAGEWRCSAAGFELAIVQQPSDPDEAWAWAVTGSPGGDPIDAGYAASLEVARSSAEDAVLRVRRFRPGTAP